MQSNQNNMYHMVKDGEEINLQYICITVFENGVPIYTTPQVLDNPRMNVELGKLLQPFVMENAINNRFLIVSAKKTEKIVFTHLTHTS